MLILVEATTGLAVNPDHVVAMKKTKYNGDPCLEIRTVDGQVLHIKDTSGYRDGTNIAQVHERLLNA
ncbi:MAG: hypothetical protein RSG92_17570 [Pseudomonas sp.]